MGPRTALVIVLLAGCSDRRGDSDHAELRGAAERAERDVREARALAARAEQEARDAQATAADAAREAREAQAQLAEATAERAALEQRSRAELDVLRKELVDLESQRVRFAELRSAARDRLIAASTPEHREKAKRALEEILVQEQRVAANKAKLTQMIADYERLLAE